jgi:4-hydroxybenzoyl-CoA thioesterase/acyl-CoA thioester hydrolase
MTQVFTAQRRVEFRDTDMAGIVHFSVFFTYMEQTEHQWLRELGLSVIGQEHAGQHLSWPRVAAQCQYRRPLKFEQLIDCQMSIAQLGQSSITYHHRFFCDGNLMAEGTVTAVCCHMETGKPPRSVPIPEPLRQAFAPFVEPAT